MELTLEPLPQAAVPAPPRVPPEVAAPGEFLSPFVPWTEADRAPLAEAQAQPGLGVALLRDPAAVVERLLDPAQTQAVVLGSLAAVALGTGFFALAAALARGAPHPLGSAGLAVLDVLMAMAAALGPIFAGSVVLAARMPLGRLVALVVASAGTGALVLAGLAPPLYVLWRLDPAWCGTLSVVGAFALSGAAGGLRAYQLLFELAEAVARSSHRARPGPAPSAAQGGLLTLVLFNVGRQRSEVLSPADVFRVGILARLSLVVVAFTSALAFWSFDAFG